MKIVDYQILTVNSEVFKLSEAIKLLERLVLDRISKGWVPQGGVNVICTEGLLSGRCSQAMVQYSDQKD